MDITYPDAEEVIKEICAIFTSHGVNGLTKHVTHDLNKWKNVKIKVAVTGHSGAGKSSLINALRGIHHGAKNAAKAREGVKETTTKKTSYIFPDNDQIELFDIPGVGTLSHPIKTYMQEMKFEQYDFVLIVSSERFSENDAIIMKALQGMQKEFYFVRSKVFADVQNEMFSQTKENVLKDIRGDCSSHLKNIGVKAKGIFLIDSHVHEDFELKDLQMTLIHDAPDLFKETLILTFKTKTKEIIGEKVKVLKRRALKVSFMAIVSALPGAKYFMNETVLKDEISFYKNILGLDDEALGKTCDDLEIDRARLQEMIAFCDFVVYPENSIEYIYNLKENWESSAPRFYNLLFGIERFLRGFARTYPKVYRGLAHIIDTLEKDSLTISENVLEKVRGTSFV